MDVDDEKVLIEDAENDFQVEQEESMVEQDEAAKSSELVFINDNVSDHELLIDGLHDNDDNRIIEVMVLDADRNGLEQVSDILANRSDLSALHFITHGADGQINLGNSWLDNNTLQQNSNAVAGWGNALTETGDILFYGCNVAANSDGQDLLDEIAELTSADVTASDDPTGHEDLGGDWDLEYKSGSIETGNAFGTDVQQNWSNLLATVTMHPTGDGSTSEFTVVGTSAWDSVNDQTDNAGTGAVEANDPADYLEGASGQRVMFSLDDMVVPNGAVINDITIHAQAYQANGVVTNVSLSYQRMSGATTPDGAPVDGAGIDLGTVSPVDISTTWSDLNWTTDDLNNLEIGVIHNSGSKTSYISQMYVSVTYTSTDAVAPTQVYNTGSTVAEGGTDTITNTKLRYDDLQPAGSVTYTINSGPTNGRFELTTDSGVAVTSWTQAQIDANQVVYVHDGSNTTSDSISFTVDDGLGNALSGQTFAITITAVNDAPTFTSGVGDGGVITAVGDGNDYIRSITVQDDGKILVAGASDIDGNSDFALTRYNTDGSLDTTFGGDGIVTTDIDSTYDSGHSVTVQNDGKILVAGYSHNGTDYDFALTRYNTDGSPDNSFGVNGIVTTDIDSNNNDFGRSVTVQDDGKILVAGYTGTTNYLFALTRYNANGSLDTSFGGGNDGKVTVDIGEGSAYGLSVTMQDDGKILVAGYTDIGSANYVFLLIRYTADGSPDTDFGGGNGIVTTNVGVGNDYGYSVTVQDDGKILVAGYSDNGTDNDFALTRYTTDGSLDTNFGDNGIVTTDVGGGNDSGYSIAVQADGKILVAGYSHNGTNYDFALTRYNTDGILDTGFGNNGKVTTPVGTGDDTGLSVTVQDDGKILVGGYSHNGTNNDFALTRYTSDGTLDVTFDLINTLDGTPTYIENNAAVVLDSDVDVSDVELDALNSGAGNYAGASLTLVRNGGASADDVLGFNDAGGITLSGGSLIKNSQVIATFDTTSTPGQLVITLTDTGGEIPTSADVDNILSQITYANTADEPPASIQIDWTFNDGNTGDQGSGGAMTATGRTTVNITAANNAPTFGVGDGIVTTDLTGNTDIAYNTVIQPDGKILVGGYVSNGGNYDFAVTRYHADGGLDTDFGSNGTVLTDFDSGTDAVRKLLLQDDGKIVVGGYALVSGSLDFAIARYNADGSVDTSFGGGDGKASTSVSPSTDGAYDMVLQDDGKIILAGMSNDGLFYKFAMVRFTSDGVLDTSFGGLNGDAVGTVTTNIGANTDTAYAVTLQPDSKILVAGTAHNSVTQDIGLARYNSDGSLDTGFGGGDGIVTTSLDATGAPGGDSGNQVGYDVAVQSDGKILVAGISSHSGNEAFTVVRYDANGTLDTSFGGDGVVTTDIDAGDDRAYTMTLQDDIKILLGGYSSGGPTGKDFALVRFDTDGSLDNTFGDDGKVIVPVASGDEEANSVTVQPDGKIVAVGFSGGMFAENFQVLKFNSDGSLDSSFDSGLLGANPTFSKGGLPVVLDSDVTIYDVELSAADDFDGASLTLLRNGGASTDDVFSATGTLGALTEGGNLSVGATMIGTVTTNSAGTLVLTFNANATNTLVNQTMQQIAYSNASGTPPASVQIDWSFNDGNTGSQGGGGALTATGSTAVTITEPPAGQIWLTTGDDVASPSNAPGLDSWTEQTIIELGDPNLSMEPGTSDGTFSVAVDFENFADAIGDVDAVHLVGSSITVGGVALQAGDVLFSVGTSTSYTSVNSVTPNPGDVYAFQPTTPGDYSSGTFTLVIDADVLGIGGITAFSLVESDVTVGGHDLEAGDFLYVAGDQDIRYYDQSASNDFLLVEGWGTNFFGDFGGIDLVEQTIQIGGTTLTAGRIVATSMDNQAEMGAEGSTKVDVLQQDLIVLDVNPSNTTATVELLWQGFDLAFGASKDWDGLSLVPASESGAAPTINLTGTALVYTEGDGAVAVDAGLTVTDIDSANLTGATVRILFGYVPTEDSLNFVDQLGITGSYDAGTGLLTLTGPASVADYQTALRSVTYQNSSENPNTSNRTINFTVTDGTLMSGNNRTVTVVSVNDAPVLLSGSVNNLTVNEDAGSTSLGLGSVTYGPGGGSDESSQTLAYEVTVIPDPVNFGKIYLADGTTQVTIGSYTLADIQGMQFAPNPDETGTAFFSFNVQDDGGTANGGSDILGQSIQITINAVNDDPTNAGSLPTDLVFLQDTQGKLDLSAIDLSDIDANGGDLTLTITSDAGHLQTMGWPGLTLGGTQSQLILTGKLTDLNDFLNDVNAINYEHATPGIYGNNVDLITIEISDNGNTGSGGGGTITLGTINIDIDPVAPRVDLDADDSAETGNNFTTTWTQGSGQIKIADTDSVITDADSGTLQSLTVTLTNHLDNADEHMVADVSGTDISVDYTVGSGEYYVYLSGADTVANYEQVLRSIEYDNTSASPNATTRVVTVQASDGTNSSNIATTTINMSITNVAPIINSNGGGDTAAINISENTTAVTTVTATDADGDTPTFSITGGSDAAKFNIDTNTGVLTFNEPPNFENPTDIDTDNVYVVEVTANDGNGGTDVQDISVTVTDVSSNIVVTTTADLNDGDVSSTEALNSDKGTDGFISLREAITAANNSADTVTISFNITDPLVDGAHTFTIGAGGLPTITDTVIIDGTTDSNYAGTPIIVLDGSGAGAVDGLSLAAGSDGSTIKGLVINGFQGNGIHITDSSNNNITGNYLGCNVYGTVDMGNTANGIYLDNASNNNIGGPNAGDGNLISGNDYNGILVDKAGSTGNVIQGNTIGTNADGDASLANAYHGVYISNASSNTIGGSNPGEGNLISGNAGHGILIQEFGTHDNLVQGNYIGTNSSGDAGVANDEDGIRIFLGSYDNTIGGTADGAGNLIAYNGGIGIQLFNPTGSGNAILRNEIYGNTGIGIDLDGGTENGYGVTDNDTGDSDTGANNLQNFPVLTSAVTNESTTITISGAINSTAGTTFRIEFFANTAEDGSSHGEGETYLGYTEVTTDGSGDASFSVPILANVAVGQFITATATNQTTNDTSEFALDVTAVSNNAPAITSDGGGATAFVNAAENQTAVTTVTATDADGDIPTFSITGGADAAKFNIDTNTGVLTFNAAPDFENPGDSDTDNVYEVQVTADDGKGGTDNQLISVTVTDGNDAPVFSPTVKDEFSTAVFTNNDGSNDWSAGWVESDGAGTGATVGNIVITGGELSIRGVGNSITREADLSNASSATLSFDFRTTSGVEAGDPDSVVIEVSNNGGTSWTVFETFDSFEGINSGSRSYDISGFTSNNTQIRFRVINGYGGPDEFFIVDNVRIQYADTISVAENTTAVTTVTATDADASDTLTYSIDLASPDADKFSINSSTGELSFLVAPNFENPTDTGADNVYNITVQVDDGNGGADTNSLTILVNDVNDAPIAFNNTVTTNEDTTYTFDAADFNFSDADGDTLASVKITSLETVGSLQLSGTDVTLNQGISKAEIDAGNLKFIPVGDENGDGYDSFGFSVNDGTVDSTSTYTMTIDVTAVNDAPVITSDGGGATAALFVAENTTAVTTVTAADGDGDTPTYSITGGEDSALFDIDTNTGALSFKIAPDFEAPGDSDADNVYEVQVTADDGNSGTDVQTINVTVTNASENSPIDLVTTATTQGGVSLNEDGGNDLYYVADNGSALLGGLTTVTIEASFSITTPGADLSPLLSYAQGSNDEELALFLKHDGRIWFGVQSNGSVLQSTVGSYNQLFDGAVHHVGVSWDSSNGAVVFYVDGQEVESFTGYQSGRTIAAGGELVFGQDQDSVLGGFKTWDVFSGSLYDVRIFNDLRTSTEIANNYYQTLPNTEPGMIADWRFDNISAGGIITESVSGNNLTEQHVVDAGFSTSEAELTLRVVEGAPNGTVLGNLTAIDPDVGETFTYALLDNAGGRFAIDPASGQLIVANATLIDFDTNTSHDIIVRVTDSGLLTYDEVFTVYVVEAAPPEIDLDYNNDSGASGRDYIADFIEGNGPVNITDSDVSLIDVDSSNLVALTAVLTNQQDGMANETLAASDPLGTGLSITWDDATSTLTISGLGSVADYLSVLATITYNNSQANPDLTDRLITFAANDGIITSQTATTRVRVSASTPGNDAPVLDNNGIMALTGIRVGEIDSSGDLVSDIIASAGGDRITDVDVGAVEGIAVTAVDDTNGTWEYSTDGGSNWSAFGAVADNSATVLTATGNNRIRFVPNVDFTGVAYMSFRAWDTTDGSVSGNAGVDASINGGNTAFSTATEEARIQVLPTEIRILFTTESDVNNSGVPGIKSWTTGDVLAIGDPNLQFEPAGSGGSVYRYFDMGQFASDGDIQMQGLHFISRDVVVGSANSINLQRGDILFICQDGETMTSLNSLTFAGGDVIAFRPDTPNDYSSGNFIHVLDQPGLLETTGISLVEADTLVGDIILQAGSFLFTQADSGSGEANNIYHYSADDVGVGTTTGTLSTLITGTDINVEWNEFIGVMLVTQDTPLNGTTVSAGTIITTLAYGDSFTGDNSIETNEDEVLTLTVTTTTMGSGTSAADVNILFDGGDIGLNNSNKKMRSLGFIEVVGTVNADPVITLPGGGINFTEGDSPTVINATATLVDPDSPDFDGGILRVEIAGNGTANDRLTVRHEGTAAGQVGVSGNNVTYGSALIGNFLGGTSGADPLFVYFNADADVAAVQAVMRNITFENTSSTPSTAQRTVEFTVTDGDMGSSAAVTTTVDVTDLVPSNAPVATDDPDGYSATIGSYNPLSYWRFGETAGESTSDAGSTANSGTFHGVTLAQAGAVNGDTDTAISFDGTDDYVEIAHNDAYLIDNGTIQLWFNADDLLTNQALFSKDSMGYDTGGHFTIRLLTDGSIDVRLQSDSDDNFLNSGAGTVNAGNWHHVVVSFGAAGMEFFLDGVSVDTNPYTGGLGTTSGGIGNYEPIAIGASTEISGNGTVTPLEEFFGGCIDEVAIFDQALTDEQIQDLYASALQNYTTLEDTPLIVNAAEGVLINDSDADDDPLTAVLVSGPSNATAFTLNPDGSFSYTPTSNFNGTDTFTYRANDGGSDSNIATVTITISPVNDAPVNTIPGTQTVLEDTQTAITGFSVADQDADNAVITTELTVTNGVLDVTLSGGASISAGANGSNTLTISGNVTDINATLATLYYTGNSNVNGIAADMLTIVTNDLGNTGASIAQNDADTVQIDITPVNDAPTFWDFHHDIDLGAATAIADYPVKIQQTEGANGFSYANAQPNGEDLRFYDSAGNALSYWIESWNPASTSTVWVKVANAGTTNIDMYYGNQDVAAASDPDATFLFHDDFVNGTTGMMPAGWTAVGGATSGTQPSVVDDSGNLVFSDGANSGGPVISGTAWSDAVVSQDFRTVNPGDLISHAGIIARYEDVDNMVYGGILDKDTAQIWYREAGVWTQIGSDWSITGMNVEDGNWHNQELRLHGNIIELYIDDAFIGSTSLAGTGSAAGTSGQTGFWSQYSNYEAYRDNHIVRSYDSGTGNIVTTLANEGYAIDENSANGTSVGHVIATDPDIADILSYSIIGGNTNSAFAINAGTGEITVNNSSALNFEATQSFTLTVQVDDGNGKTDTDSLTILVNDVNDAPIAFDNTVTFNEDTTYTFTVADFNFSDADGDTLASVKITSLETVGSLRLSGANVTLNQVISRADIDAGNLKFIPVGDENGDGYDSFGFSVNDGTTDSAGTYMMTINITAVNDAPVLAVIGNQTVDEGATLTFTASATDSDEPADTLTFSLDAASIALGMTIDANTGEFSWTPTEAQGGLTPSVTITVTDDGTGTLTDSETFTISINDTNTAPVLAPIGNQTVDEGATLTFTASATDSDLPANTLMFSLDAASLVLGMTIDANTGEFSWSPTEAQGGLTPSVTITVTDDGTGTLTDSETFTISVNDTNTAPVLAPIGNQTVDEGSTLTFTVSATDSDTPADTLIYSLDATSIALGMTINENTGEFSWTPTEAQGGLTPSVTITVTDDGAGTLTDSETFIITVNDTNTAPILAAIGNQTVDEGSTLNFMASATDSDDPANTLTYSLDATSIALGMTIDANTGDFSWTPTEAQGGLTPSVTITVTDNGTGTLSDSETFTISVNDTNTAPVLDAIGNQTVDEGSTLTFNALATDSDIPADTLTYSLDAASIALGMTIDANTGDFSWTPTEAQGDLTPSVTITVTDDGTGSLSDSETFTISVNDTNTAPVLNAIGNQTVDEGSTLAFTASTTDIDEPADTLTYSLDATSIALGMTIDANTGYFSWTPTEAQGGLTPSVTITVTDDGTGTLTDSETFTITVNDTNTAPVLAAIGNQTVDEGATLTFTASATDSDEPADTLTYSLDAASIALGMTIDANTGEFSWTPTEAQGDLTPSVTVTVTDDGTGTLTDSETFTITVNDTNTAPVLAAIGNQTVDEGAMLTFTASATDSDNPSDTLTYSLDAASIALGMTIDANTGKFSWTPTEAQGGLTPSVTITVTDNGTGTLTDSETFTITVNDTNTAPILAAIGNQTVDEGATLTFTASATDSDEPANTLTYSLDAASIALGMTIDANTGEFSWSPTEAQGGLTPSVTITVTDDGAGTLTDSETFTITVNDTNTAPVLAAIDNQTVDEGATLTFTASATDSDEPADTLIYSLDAASIALGMTIDANTGEFSWAPTEAQGGLTPSVTITVTDDGTGTLSDSETFTITVNDTNTAPILAAIGNHTVDEGSTLTFTASATDNDDPVDNLTYSLDAASIALGMTIDSNTGEFSWTPTEAQGGLTPSVTITVTDNGTGTLSDSKTFTITVNNTNTAPVLAAIDNQTVDEGTTLTFTASATDSDEPADTLTYSLDAASIALGMTIDANTGEFSWTPTEAQGGLTPSVTITVTDNGSGTLSDSETFTITVNGTNTAPVLAAIGNQTVDEGATLAFTASATDSDDPADTLTYSLDAASIALGMTIDANTGDLSWTPIEAQGGLTPSVTITVTDDGTGTLSDSETFTITVNDTNTAPILAAIGNQTVDEGSTLTFTASATDADLPADTLTFSLDAASLALGMTIDANTGDFSWTPTEAQGGLTPSVTVTVTDDGTGTLTDSETFTITVNETNTAPILNAIGNQTVDEGSTLAFTASATDSDDPANTLTYSLDPASIALGMTIDANTGGFSWTPTEAQGGQTPSVTITVTDVGTGTLTDSETFTITINDTNTAPILAAIGNQTVDEGATLTFTASATDSDDPADTLTYSLDAASMALGMTIDANTGDFSWTPTEAQGGLTPSVTITVTDDGTGTLTDSETFTITVNDTNTAPILAAIGNQTVDEGATLAFTASATDSDDPADTLTYSLDAASIALGMTIDANTGDFSWTPTEAQGGLTPSVTITVTDNGTGTLTDSETFTITANGTNTAPVLAAIGNQTVDEGATLAFTASATDSDDPADTLTYSLDAASIALGMTIDANTGDFSWTPTEAQGGLTPSVTITVTDDDTGILSDSKTFTITVNEINNTVGLITDSDATANTVSEDAIVGTTVGVTALAVDVDVTDNVTYSFIDDAGGRFVIDTDTGVITVNGTMDYETDTSHSVTVLASSTDGSTNTQTFTIDVNDVNESRVDPASNAGSTVIDVGTNPITNIDLINNDNKTGEENDKIQDIDNQEINDPFEITLDVDESTHENETTREIDPEVMDELIAEVEEPNIEDNDIVYLIDETDKNIQSKEKTNEDSYIYIDYKTYKEIIINLPSDYDYKKSDYVMDLSEISDLDNIDIKYDGAGQIANKEEFNLVRNEIDEAFTAEQQSESFITKIASITVASFSFGIVTYFLRAASLLTSMLSTFSLWRRFDPIVIFSGKEMQKTNANDIDPDEIKPETIFGDDSK